MSDSLFDSFAGELRQWLSPFLRIAQDPLALDEFLRSVGVIVPDAQRAPLLAAMTSISGLEQQLDQVLEQPPASFESITALFDVARGLLNAVRALDQVSVSSPGLAGIGADLVNVMLSARMAARHPVARGVAALLGLAELAEDRDPQPAVVQAGEVIRRPFRLDRYHLDRVPDLVRDPVPALRHEYGNPLATGDDANTLADRLFPRVQRILRDLGVTCRYGIDPDDQLRLGDTASFLDHALVVYADDVLGGAPAEAGLVFSLSPASRGDLGLVISPFGALTSTRTLSRWVIELQLSAGVSAFAWGRNGVTLPASTASTEIVARVTATLAPSDDAVPYVFGARDGTRLEIGGARLSIEAQLSGGDPSLALSGDISAAALVIEPGDADGFLSSVLPASGTRADFALGLSWSDRAGLTLRGSGGLDSVLPVHRSLGPVGSIDVVQLGLTATDDGLLAGVSCGVTINLGPVTVTAGGLGVATTLGFPASGGNVGVADVDVGFSSPSLLGLSVDAGAVTGSGFLAFDPGHGQYAGEMHLQFEGIAVRALGLLTTRLPDGKPGFSLLVLVSADFPPVQLGLGFMLVGVGGLLGINRTVAIEALRAGLKTGALAAVLSPPDPKASAGQIVSSLSGVFPPAAGRHVFAPTARIVWGSPVLITIELALVFELPAPVRLVVLGRLRAILPDEHEATVHIEVDMLGVIDVDQATAAVDATLVDSRLAQFALTGDLALRMSWGDAPSFLLAVGGFHPRFAAPAGFPALSRVAIALATGDNPKLRLEAYLALTSNTVQFGARIDLGARAGSFSIAGFLSFDALVTLAPLAFVADIAAKLAVKAGSHTILSLSLDLTLSGPSPWRAHGRASFSILFFDISFGFDVTIGDTAAPELPAPVDVAPLLLAALADARSWHAPLPAGSAAPVTLCPIDPGTEILAHPQATLQVRQRVAPLARTLDRFGSTVPSGARRFTITLAMIGGIRTTLTALQDRFAPAQFFALNDEQRLCAPSFEDMAAGAALGADDYATGAPVSLTVAYEQVLITAPGVAQPPSQRVSIPGDIFASLTATRPERTPVFAVRDQA